MSAPHQTTPVSPSLGELILQLWQDRLLIALCLIAGIIVGLAIVQFTGKVRATLYVHLLQLPLESDARQDVNAGLQADLAARWWLRFGAWNKTQQPRVDEIIESTEMPGLVRITLVAGNKKSLLQYASMISAEIAADLDHEYGFLRAQYEKSLASVEAHLVSDRRYEASEMSLSATPSRDTSALLAAAHRNRLVLHQLRDHAYDIVTPREDKDLRMSPPLLPVILATALFTMLLGLLTAWSVRAARLAARS